MSVPRRGPRTLSGFSTAPRRPPAVLVGPDGSQGLQAARILHDRRVPVIAFAKDPHNGHDTEPAHSRQCAVMRACP
jgi:hypothetical protein